MAGTSATTDGVVHVAARLVGDPRAGLAQRGHLPGVDRRDVSHDRAFAEDAAAAQAVDRAQTVLCEAVLLVGGTFGGVDVEADVAQRLGLGYTGG